MISLTRVLCLQDLNNSNLNKGGSGSGYGAPGGPISSPPFYRVHGGDLSPRPFTATSPSTQRPQSSMNLSPSSFTPSFPAGGPVSPSTGGSGVYLHPELLVNKSPSELPQGVDPSRREVGAELWVKCKWCKNMELIMSNLLLIVGLLQADG